MANEILTTTPCVWENEEIETVETTQTLASSQTLQWMENTLVKLEV